MIRQAFGCTVLGLAVLAIGCAGESEEATGDDQGAISHQDAAKERNLKEVVVPDVAASPGNQRELGIVKWNVYAQMDNSFAGTVSFATDADGDVKYALVVDGRSERMAVVTYDKNGVDKSAAPVTPAVYEKLYADFLILDAKVKEAAKRSNANSCALRLAAATIGVAVIAGGGWALTTTVVGVSELIAIFGPGAAATTAAVGTKTAVGAAVIVGAASFTRIGREQFNQTVTVCKAAFQGK